MLEEDIINDPILLGFIERYCKEEGKWELQAGLNRVAEAMLNEWGIGDEGLRWHQVVVEDIKRLQKNFLSGYSKPHLTYDSVINEFGIDMKNPFAGLLQGLFF